jgi:hypothetical protein
MKSTQEIREDFVSISNELAQLQLGKKESFELALVILKEYGRYSRGNEAANSRANGNGSNNNKPTSKEQKQYLLDLGAKEEEIPATSREASKKIEELKRNGKGRYPAPSFK